MSNVKKDFKSYLLGKEEELTYYMGQPLTEPDCFISWNGVRLISPSTLLTIQGKSGSHKSRLAQEFAIVLMDNDEDSIGSKLGMTKIVNRPLRVAYIDTERNSNFEFPFALKSIADSCGVQVPCKQFRYTTLRDLDRTDRKEAAEQFIDMVRKDYEGDLIVIVDVASDLTLDFNSVTATGELIDLFKKWMNVFKCAIITVIHENPGSSKMRGHLGTELSNKATDSISIKKIKEENSIAVQFEKNRYDGAQNEIGCIYNSTTRRLELQAPMYEPNIIDRFLNLLSQLYQEKDEYTRPELVSICSQALNRSQDSMDAYLSNIQKLTVNGIEYQFIKGKKGKFTTYSIKPILGSAKTLE